MSSAVASDNARVLNRDHYDQMLYQEQLRTARTKFVQRWQAAHTIGEWLGNDAVGELAIGVWMLEGLLPIGL